MFFSGKLDVRRPEARSLTWAQIHRANVNRNDFCICIFYVNSELHFSIARRGGSWLRPTNDMERDHFEKSLKIINIIKGAFNMNPKSVVSHANYPIAFSVDLARQGLWHNERDTHTNQWHWHALNHRHTTSSICDHDHRETPTIPALVLLTVATHTQATWTPCLWEMHACGVCKFAQHVPLQQRTNNAPNRWACTAHSHSFISHVKQRGVPH